MGAAKDPLYELRPPNADMATYLTYVEENLTKEKLPILHDVLQDEELTEEIGWDLVKTLIPLAPESEECLMDVAKHGNTKEVILKVVESLRAIDFEEEEEDEDEEEETDEEIERKTINLSLPYLQFQILLRMLAVLHPRIKAKFPSRFLSATLQALIASFPFGSLQQDELATDLVAFVKVVSGAKRPPFPPRRSSSTIGLATVSSFPSNPLTLVESTTEEEKIHNRLLQSFVTHLLDDYMQSLAPVEGVPGLAYCGRYMEKIKHPLVVTHKISLTDQFSNSQILENRLTTVGQLVALAEDLDINSDELLQVITNPNPEVEGDRDAEESYPQSSSEIPLSKPGALYLLTARRAMGLLSDGSSIQFNIPIFPTHSAILQSFSASRGAEAMTLEPDPLLDAMLFHGLVAVENNDVGYPESDEAFAEYLQITSLLSANVASDELRFQAHYLTTTVLRSHPKELIRFSYIKDTLEHCPFENLKASAVGWVKGEIMDAFQQANNNDDSLFLTPIPLSTLAPFLFPDLSTEYGNTLSLSESEQIDLLGDFEQHYGFYASSLNLLYFLLMNEALRKRLQIKELLEEHDVYKVYVTSMHKALRVLRKGLKEGDLANGELEDDFERRSVEVELGLMRCENVDSKLKELGWVEADEVHDD